MNGKDIKSIIKTAVSLFIICAVSSAILALVNEVTEKTIEINNAATAEEARKTVMPDAESFNEITLDSGVGYEALSSDGKTIGYVFTTTENSYGGTIEVMTGINTDGTISQISILSISDTPGLGMKAKEESFYGQYTGKDISTGELSVNKDGGDITAITSATITSRAVTKAVNKAADLWKEATKEG